MTNITTYDFHEDPIRIVQDDFGALWFVFRDAALALGYANPDQVKSRIPEANLCQIEVRNVRGELRSTWCVNLEGLNYLIFGSTKPEAEDFKKLAAAIMAEYQTTGQVQPKQSLPNPNQPIAHLLEGTRKTTSKSVNAVAYAQGGSPAAIAVNVGLSTHFFGATPKQMSKFIQEQSGRKYAKSKSLPQALTENVPHIAAMFSLYKQAVLQGTDQDKAKRVALAFEAGFQTALEEGIDPQTLLQ